MLQRSSYNYVYLCAAEYPSRSPVSRPYIGQPSLTLSIEPYTRRSSQLDPGHRRIGATSDELVRRPPKRVNSSCQETTVQRVVRVFNDISSSKRLGESVSTHTICRPSNVFLSNKFLQPPLELIKYQREDITMSQKEVSSPMA